MKIVKKVLITATMVILAVLSAAIYGFSPETAVSEDYGPSELHEILARAKAERLDLLRAAAEGYLEAPRDHEQTEYDVNYYRIALMIDVPSETIHGDVGLQARSTIDGLDSLELDLLSNLAVDSVYNASGQLGFYQAGGRLVIELDRVYDVDEFFELDVTYSGTPVITGLEGFTFEERYGYPVVSSLSEPISARSWWPCKDRPDDKADSLDIHITCDTALFCASNGILVDTVRNGDGTWTFDYEVRYPIATYLFSVAVSVYSIWNDWYYYGDNDSMEIIHYVFPDRYGHSLNHYDITPYAIGVFADLFGEYPFVEEKYGHANFNWSGCMEHQTVSSMSGGMIGFLESIVVHELAHQWWGDMITLNNWHEIWLNEGFATYSEALYYEVKDGPASYHDYMEDMTYTSGGSIYIIDTTDTWNIFSRRVYDKGAWVLHMLRHVVGDSVFFDILQTYYASEYGYADATTEDFKNICESVSGMELDQFFEQWIYGTYFPRYYLSYFHEIDSVAGGYYNYLHLRQAQSSPPQVFVMPVDLVFDYFSGPADTVVLYNDVRDSVYIIKTDEMPALISVDPANWILKQYFATGWTYHLIPFPLDTARQYAYYLDSIVARGSAYGDSFAVSGGSFPDGLTLEALTGRISGIPTEAGEFAFEVTVWERDGLYSDTRGYRMLVEPSDYTAGDVNQDDSINILDILYLIDYLYKGGPPPANGNQSDPDASCEIDILDITYLINFLYKGGPGPVWGCAGD